MVVEGTPPPPSKPLGVSRKHQHTLRWLVTVHWEEAAQAAASNEARLPFVVNHKQARDLQKTKAAAAADGTTAATSPRRAKR